MSYTYDWCGHVAEGADRPCGAPVERWSREWKHRTRELDADHSAEAAPPVGPMDEGLALRADRYAAALAAAVVADERIAALTELVARHEWYRSQAESQLSMVAGDPQFGTLWSQTGPEPSYEMAQMDGSTETEHPRALLCLTTGSVYVRSQWTEDWQLAYHDPLEATHYVWPIPDAGPFIAWHDGYDFQRVLDAARALATEHRELHRAMYSEPGYRAEGASPYGRPRLAEALFRIRLAQMHRTHEANAKAQAADQKLRQLRRLLEDLEPDDTQEWPTDDAHSHDGGDEAVRTVHVVELQRIYDLLALPSTGGVA